MAVKFSRDLLPENQFGHAQDLEFCVAAARGKAMADWKRLTSPSGDTVYLNLDVMIGMQRNPDINITFLQSVSDPRVNIEVRETPDEILS